MIGITYTAAKPLISVGHKFSLIAAHYFTKKKSLLGDIRPQTYSGLPVLLNEAMFSHHLTSCIIKATYTLSNHF